MVMVVRRRGMPLVRGAIVGGTAYAMGRRRAADEAQQAEAEAYQNQQLEQLHAQQAQYAAQASAAPAAPAAAASGGGSIADQLANLGAMAQQGLLSPEEFAAAKAKLLG